MLNKDVAINAVNRIVNYFFDNTGDWAAASGLNSRLLSVIEEYFNSENDQKPNIPPEARENHGT